MSKVWFYSSDGKWCFELSHRGSLKTPSGWNICLRVSCTIYITRRKEHGCFTLSCGFSLIFKHYTCLHCLMAPLSSHSKSKRTLPMSSSSMSNFEPLCNNRKWASLTHNCVNVMSVCSCFLPMKLNSRLEWFVSFFCLCMLVWIIVLITELRGEAFKATV